MTCGTILGRVQTIECSPFGTGFKEIAQGDIESPIELGHEIRISNMWVWIAMTFKTPTHVQRFMLKNGFHRVDATVAFDTTHTSCDMCAMVEIRILWKIVYPYPLDRHSRSVTFKKRGKFFAFWMNLRMAVHTCLCWGNCSVGCVLNRVVAIPAIDPEFAGVKSMAEGYRLLWSVPNICCLWTKPICNEDCDIQRCGHPDHSDHRQCQIRPLRKYKPLF